MSSLGVEGVVIGKALYEGTLTIEEALEAANE
jgi:phosphoribosylformimino-5-aminoimidazole carboxamide ribonucleotide (ProFAR) isomerase